MVHWFNSQLFWLKRYCMRHGVNAFLALFLVYFVLHGLNGERGYLARQDTMRELHERQELLASLVLQREELAGKVEAMRPGRSQADMIEQELYKLGYINPGDVIIYRGEFEKPGTVN